MRIREDSTESRRKVASAAKNLAQATEFKGLKSSEGLKRMANKLQAWAQSDPRGSSKSGQAASND